MFKTKVFLFLYVSDVAESKQASSDHVIDMIPGRSKAPSAVGQSQRCLCAACFWFRSRQKSFLYTVAVWR